jgi:transposase InsO family protein
VFSVFKKFKVLVVKESGYSLKLLRTYKGGEFYSNDFNKFCEDHGIKRLLIVPRSPQQNGMVERRIEASLTWR